MDSNLIFSRRAALKGGAALAVSAVGNDALAVNPAGPGLNAIAQSKGMRFGSALSSGGANAGSFRNPAYAEMLKRDCGVLVGENEMKWQFTRPSRDSFNFAGFDEQTAFAKANNIAMRGHNLLWHRVQWMPDWLEKHDFGANPRREAEKILTTHIKTVTNRYRDMITSFDVVNETVIEDSSLAETALSRAMGGTLPLVDLAFHTARQQLPNAELLYNDYMGWEPGNEKHRAGVLRLMEGFKKRGVPVDALGLQSHLRIDSYDPKTGTGPRQEREWRKFLDEITGMGYGLMITEFDVNDQALPGDIGVRDAAVAAYAKAYLDLTLSYTQVKDVLAWGMCDAYTWLQLFKPVRNDGLPKRATPYDSNHKPKPLYDAIAKAFAAAPQR
jgi:endo-1,4-beta-xylanase